MKKLIPILASVMAMLSVNADTWYEEATGYTWSYTVSGETATITGVSPTESDKGLPIPAEINGKIVMSIGRNAFLDCSGLTGPLTIPASVTSIGVNAFRGCSGLAGSLTIPAGVTSVALGAFRDCSGLTGSLTIPAGVTSIEKLAFDGCSGLTGPLTIPAGVTSIGSQAFSHCSGLTGSLTIPARVKEIGEYAFSQCNFQTVVCAGEMPKGWKQIPFGVGVQLNRANSGSWLNGGLPIQNFAGYINDEVPAVTIVSSKVREDDATVIDVTYKVTSAKPTVKVRVLAFEDGERSLAKVVRPETFVDGTAVNVGDGVTANEEHTISWKVSEDWATKLAKVKVEVLAMDDALLPLELMTLPATATQPKMQVSWNHVWPEKVFDALLWLYADKDEGLVLQDGVLKTGDKRLAQGTGLSDSIGFDARVYVYGKMGYELLDGGRLDYVKARTRLDLPDKSVRQYAVKVVE